MLARTDRPGQPDRWSRLTGRFFALEQFLFADYDRDDDQWRENSAANWGTLRPREFHLNPSANIPRLHEVFQPVFLGSDAHVEVHEIAWRLDNSVTLLE